MKSVRAHLKGTDYVLFSRVVLGFLRTITIHISHNDMKMDSFLEKLLAADMEVISIHRICDKMCSIHRT